MSVASSVTAFIFSQLSLACDALFSASSRNAAGTSILGISKLGISNAGISKADFLVLKLASVIADPSGVRVLAAAPYLSSAMVRCNKIVALHHFPSIFRDLALTGAGPWRF